MLDRRWLLLASFVVALVATISQPAHGQEEESVVSPTVTTDDATATPNLSVRARIRNAAMQWLNHSGGRRVTAFGLVYDDVDDLANDAKANKPWVILVHGFNSSPERAAALLKPIRDAGFPCIAFRYPNDQAIADSAELLSRELKAFVEQHPNDEIALVTYSMGGLVAREVVENPQLDVANVKQLIMVAPPSQGTSCARIACSGDIWEHGVRGQHEGILDRIYACLEDGWGEARHDLKPGSPFLKRLNGRPRNGRIRYSILLGTGGPLTPAQLEQAQRMVKKTAESNRFVAVLQPALDRAIADLGDAVEEGDGVVSVARGRLEGVSDTVLLDFNHWNVIEDAEDEPVAAVHREILKRLADEPAQE